MVALWQFEIGKLWDNFAKFTPVQCAFVLAVLLIIGGFILAYKKLVPGTIQQASSDKERDDTVGVLKAENARLVAEKTAIESRGNSEREMANQRERDLRKSYEGRIEELESEVRNYLKTWDNPMALRHRAKEVEEEFKA